MKKITKYMFYSIFSLIMLFIVNNKEIKAFDSWGSVNVVLNADSNGNPTNVYDKGEEIVNEEGVSVTIYKKAQYTISRDIEISAYFTEDITDVVREFGVCEVIPENTENNTTEISYCSTYEVRPEAVTVVNSEGQEENKFVLKGILQLRGIEDGEKEINIIFVNGADRVTYTKYINLDTMGPVINLEGGEYIYLPSGEEYQEPGATCDDDSDIKTDTCAVIIEEKTIATNKEGYQYIRYTATDFLGNETNVLRKIMVEIPTDEGGISLYWIIAGIIVLVVSAFLVYTVVKNKEKQRNQSVL